MSSRTPQNDPQEAPNDPQEGEKEPQEGQSERWEASGSVLGRISDAFPSNARRPRRSLLKPPARARSARARLQAGAAARMFSQPSPGSSQKAPKKTHEKLTAVPRGAVPCFFSPLLVLVSSSSPSLAMLAALASHALPVPSIARFRFLGVFCQPLDFSKNATLSMRKPCFLISGGSQNGAKMAPKMLRKIKLRCGGPPGEPQGAILEVFGGPKRLPKGSRDRPGSARRAPGGSK